MELLHLLNGLVRVDIKQRNYECRHSMPYIYYIELITIMIKNLYYNASSHLDLS